jgi:hypothetical protein
MTDAYEVLYQRAVDAAEAAAGGARRAAVAVGPGWEIPTAPPLPGLDDDVPQIGGSGGRSTRIEPIPRRG